MRRLIPGAAVAAVILLMTGCAGGEAAPVPEQTSAVEPETVETLTAEEPAEEAPEAGTAETTYLETVRAELRPENVIPDATDEQLLSAGEEACEQMAEGKDFSQVAVIDGEQVNGLGIYQDSSLIATVAQRTICP